MARRKRCFYHGLLGLIFAQLTIPLAAQEDENPYPARVRSGADFRARGESSEHPEFNAAIHSAFLLYCSRAFVGFAPRPGLTIFLEGQDARGLDVTGALIDDRTANYAELRRAYVQFGAEKQPWRIRLGRQELNVGDERLVSSDSEWDPVGGSWDAAVARYERRSRFLEIFAAWPTASHYRRFDRTTLADALIGVHGQLAFRGGTIRPYVLIDSVRPSLWQDERGLGRTLTTWGAVMTGPLPKRFDYSVEAAFQHGHYGALPHRASALHAEVGFTMGRDDRSPRWSAEMNYASGDGDPADSVHSTFNDLHSANYNKHGLADPFAWRNTRNAGLSIDWGIVRDFNLSAGFLTSRLDSRRDGLYLPGEECPLTRYAALSADLGRQALIGMQWEITNRMRFAAGYSRWIPGAYLRRVELRERWNSSFVQVSYQLGNDR